MLTSSKTFINYYILLCKNVFFVYWCLVFFIIEVSILVPRAILSYSLYSRKPSLRVREHVWRGRLYISKTCASYIDWSESQNPNQVQVWLDPLSACNPTPQHVCSHTRNGQRICRPQYFGVEQVQSLQSFRTLCDLSNAGYIIQTDKNMHAQKNC